MGDIKNIISHLQQNGISRANRFRVTIPLPSSINDLTSPTTDDPSETERWLKSGIRVVKAASGGGVEASRSLQLLCSTIQIPGVNINTSKSEQSGHKFSLAVGADMSDLRVGFLLSRDFAEKKTLDNWQTLIYNERTAKVGYFKDYVTDVQVDILDEFDRNVYSFTAQESYPNIFNAIELDKSESGSFLYYRLGFVFSKIVYGDQKIETVNPLRNVRPYQILEDIHNGNTAGAVSKARDIIVRARDGSFSTEMGKDMHKMIGDIVRSPSGVSDTVGSVVGGLGQLNEAVGSVLDPSAINSALAGVKSEIESLDSLDQGEKSTLLEMVRELIAASK